MSSSTLDRVGRGDAQDLGIQVLLNYDLAPCSCHLGCVFYKQAWAITLKWRPPCPRRPTKGEAVASSSASWESRNQQVNAAVQLWIFCAPLQYAIAGRIKWRLCVCVADHAVLLPDVPSGDDPICFWLRGKDSFRRACMMHATCARRNRDETVTKPFEFYRQNNETTRFYKILYTYNILYFLAGLGGLDVCGPSMDRWVELGILYWYIPLPRQADFKKCRKAKKV